MGFSQTQLAWEVSLGKMERREKTGKGRKPKRVRSQLRHHCAQLQHMPPKNSGKQNRTRASGKGTKALTQSLAIGLRTETQPVADGVEVQGVKRQPPLWEALQVGLLGKLSANVTRLPAVGRPCTPGWGPRHCNALKAPRSSCPQASFRQSPSPRTTFPIPSSSSATPPCPPPSKSRPLGGLP